ncbi:hypothetical protein DBR06_SOUSAS19910020, partial [Sousa chinensis]
HPWPGGRSRPVFVLCSEGVAVGMRESVAYFNSPWGSKFACGLLKVIEVFLHSVVGSKASVPHINFGLLLFTVPAEGHRDRQRPRRGFRGSHQNPPARPYAQSQKDTCTCVNTHKHRLTHRPTYVPEFLQLCCQTCILFSVRDRGPWEAGSGITPR